MCNGKLDIESFLRTVVMANTGLQQEIRIEKTGQKATANDNRVIALVTFRKGNSLTGRFTFEIENLDGLKRSKRKIKCLNIGFID